MKVDFYVLVGTTCGVCFFKHCKFNTVLSLFSNHVHTQGFELTCKGKKIQVKFSSHLIKHHAMKIYGVLVVQRNHS
jgi:hypothetical protein